jgi:glycosyltransferase involved in cell wall biosynthesis
MNNIPFVSVLMPVRNEGAFIERSLAAVLAQDYSPNRMEILVADGMSTDTTRDVVLRLKANSAIPIMLLDNPGQIVPTGLNVAIARSKGEVIIRVDGHCEIANDYVSRCVQSLAETEADGVGGPIETLGDSEISQAIATAMSSPFGVGNSAFRTVNDREMVVDTVAFPAYTRRAVQLAGPFDEELVRNQDDEYNFRLRELGGRIMLSPKIKSRYYSRGTLRSLWKQYIQYGFWKVRVMQKHPRQMSLRQFIPPAFVSALLSSMLLASFSTAGRLLLLLVCGSYIGANLIASMLTVRKHNWRHVTLLPIVFATLHLSYGTGFLVGLIRFWNRWGDKQTKSDSAIKRSNSDGADSTLVRS